MVENKKDIDLIVSELDQYREKIINKRWFKKLLGLVIFVVLLSFDTGYFKDISQNFKTIFCDEDVFPVLRALMSFFYVLSLYLLITAPIDYFINRIFKDIAISNETLSNICKLNFIDSGSFLLLIKEKNEKGLVLLINCEKFISSEINLIDRAIERTEEKINMETNLFEAESLTGNRGIFFQESLDLLREETVRALDWLYLVRQVFIF